jgi:hypothetical protein
MIEASKENSMYCSQCGTQVNPGQTFCTKCGQSIAASTSTADPASLPDFSIAPTMITTPTRPTMPAALARPSRVARHLSVLGILWIVLSVLRLVPGVAMLVFRHMRFPFMLIPISGHMRSFLSPFMVAVGLLISGFAIAGAIAGWGLMDRRPWARMLAIILGCISLIHFPFGTALGVYTLWVLIPEGGETEYLRLARIN